MKALWDDNRRHPHLGVKCHIHGEDGQSAVQLCLQQNMTQCCPKKAPRSCCQVHRGAENWQHPVQQPDRSEQVHSQESALLLNSLRTWNAMDRMPGSSHVARRIIMKQLMADDRMPPRYSMLQAVETHSCEITKPCHPEDSQERFVTSIAGSKDAAGASMHGECRVAAERIVGYSHNKGNLQSHQRGCLTCGGGTPGLRRRSTGTASPCPGTPSAPGPSPWTPLRQSAAPARHPARMPHPPAARTCEHSSRSRAVVRLASDVPLVCQGDDGDSSVS